MRKVAARIRDGFIVVSFATVLVDISIRLATCGDMGLIAFFGLGRY